MENSRFKEDYLTFVIDDKTYAFPVLSLEGVIGNPQILSVINAPAFVNGITCIKEQFVPVLDLRLILNRPNIYKQGKVCMILVRVVLNNIKRLVGFIVDSLFNIYDFNAYKIEKLPFNENEEFIKGVVNIDDKMILPLDPARLINSERIVSFLSRIWGMKNKNSNARY